MYISGADWLSDICSKSYSDFENIFVPRYETKNVSYIGPSGFNGPFTTMCVILLTSFDSLSFEFTIVHTQIAYEDILAIGSPSLIAFYQLSSALVVESGYSGTALDGNSPKALYYPGTSAVILYLENYELVITTDLDLVYYKRPIRNEFEIHISKTGNYRCLCIRQKMWIDLLRISRNVSWLISPRTSDLRQSHTSHSIALFTSQRNFCNFFSFFFSSFFVTRNNIMYWWFRMWECWWHCLSPWSSSMWQLLSLRGFFRRIQLRYNLFIKYKSITEYSFFLFFSE